MKTFPLKLSEETSKQMKVLAAFAGKSCGAWATEYWAQFVEQEFKKIIKK